MKGEPAAIGPEATTEGRVGPTRARGRSIGVIYEPREPLGMGCRINGLRVVALSSRYRRKPALALCDRRWCEQAVAEWCVLTLRAGEERVGISPGEATWQEARPIVRDMGDMS
jgi:hypothetical protein